MREMQSWQSGVETRGCKDVVTGVLQEWPWINLEFPGKNLPYVEGQGSYSAHLDPDCIFKSLDQKKKKKNFSHTKYSERTKLNIPVYPEPSFTHNQNFQKCNENNNPNETLSKGFTATMASKGDNASPALCHFSTQRPRVHILLPSEFLPKLFALLGTAFQFHLSDSTSLFTFSSKTSYVLLCDSQIPLLHSRALNWCFCYDDHKFWVTYVSFISLFSFSQGIF